MLRGEPLWPQIAGYAKGSSSSSRSKCDGFNVILLNQVANNLWVGLPGLCEATWRIYQNPTAGFLAATGGAPSPPVIPAKAGIQRKRQCPSHVALDSRFRGNDERMMD